ncbi:hypothetical protein N411_00730 [Helicobacter pylori FD535]|nr:hypothetical protein N411_00730 [Helicobacter pylori FD535]
MALFYGELIQKSALKHKAIFTPTPNKNKAFLKKR